ncbi:MAG: hypothetical protein U0Y10_24470 [Spirosomataceae bacterium]
MKKQAKAIAKAPQFNVLTSAKMQTLKGGLHVRRAGEGQQG